MPGQLQTDFEYKENDKMKIYYLGNQVAGLIGKLTVIGLGHQIVNDVYKSDVLLSVHHRKIIPRNIFEVPKIASINVHPYLYKYKGADPIGRAITDENWNASVGCHHIIEEVDSGDVVSELFFDVEPSKNRCEIYNQLYPYYSKVITDSLNKMDDGYFGTFLTDYKDDGSIS